MKWGPFFRGNGTMLLMVQKSGTHLLSMKAYEKLGYSPYQLVSPIPSINSTSHLCHLFLLDHQGLDPRDVVPLADTTAKCLGAVVVARYTRSNLQVNYPGLGNPTWLLMRKCRRPKRTGSSSNPSYRRGYVHVLGVVDVIFGGIWCDEIEHVQTQIFCVLSW